MTNKTSKKEELWIIRDKYKGKTTSRLPEDLLRLRAGEPVDYIIGWKVFLGCKIDLSLKPLIPRDETEFWVEQVIAKINNSPLPKVNVLDIFAGSGCIGVGILKNTKLARVTVAEIDKKLIDQIKLNLKNNRIKKEKYKVVQSDIFSNIKEKYDFILANPPYIPTSHVHKVQKSVLQNEPHKALFGGKNGLKFIEHFLKKAKKHLKKRGQIWLEFDPSQKKALEDIIEKNNYPSWRFEKDQYKRWRFVIISSE